MADLHGGRVPQSNFKLDSKRLRQLDILEFTQLLKTVRDVSYDLNFVRANQGKVIMMQNLKYILSDISPRKTQRLSLCVQLVDIIC